MIIKNTANTDDWWVVDMMRGVFQGSNDALLKANKNDAEDSNADYINFDASGFTVHTSYGIANENGSNYIYMAIRRPMKAPEYGTDVFAASAGSSSGLLTFDTNFRVDFNWLKGYTTTSVWYVNTRLTGQRYVAFDSSNQESSLGINWDRMTGWQHTSTGDYTAYFGWSFKRAAKFLDILTWIGNSSAGRALDHNLGVVPELMFVKNGDAGVNWMVYHKDLDASAPQDKYLSLNSNSGIQDTALVPWNDTAPTSTTLTVSAYAGVNESPRAYIAYLFATLAGVSKVGSYSGTGSTINVDCGFSAGARFVLIKRTDDAGNWFLYDSVRGIVASQDPYLYLNTTAAQSSVNDDIDPLSSGFSIPSGSNVNTNGANYIF